MIFQVDREKFGGDKISPRKLTNTGAGQGKEQGAEEWPPPQCQAGELSARERDTTPGDGREAD
jgi:hypothetical protein